MRLTCAPLDPCLSVRGGEYQRLDRENVNFNFTFNHLETLLCSDKKKESISFKKSPHFINKEIITILQKEINICKKKHFHH